MNSNLGIVARLALSGLLASALATPGGAQPAAGGGTTALNELAALDGSQGGSGHAAAVNASFAFPAPAFGAQTGGAYVPPPGADLSTASTYIDMTCNPDKTVARVIAAGALIFKGNAFNPLDPARPGSLNLLDGKLTEDNSDAGQKIELVNGIQIAVRSTLQSPWIIVGEISKEDLVEACLHLPANSTMPEHPTPLVPVKILPGARFSFTRSMGMSMCWSLPDSYTRERFLTYRISVSADGGASQTFTAQEVVAFPDRPSCRNWKEAPWVSE